MSHDHDQTDPPSELELRVKALESLLVDKGLVNPETLAEIVDTYENRVGPHIGASLIARAWKDRGFKEALLNDTYKTVSELGYYGRQGEHLKVVENTPETHNLVVCTLCSCYPWTVLGLPPVWYKSAPYRSRAVSEPRAVLEEFGTTLDPKVRIRVWDSTSEMRYLVLPMQPQGTEKWDIEKLQQLVSRNAMIGVEQARLPEEIEV